MSKIVDQLKQFDEKISYKCFRSVPKTRKWKSILKSFEFSCHGIGWLAITLILIYLNPGFEPYTYLFGGLILDIIYVGLIKACTRRRRPIYAQQTDQLFMIMSDKHSFPSGHATRAIYISFFINLFFKNTILTTLFTVWAICVAVSRVLLGRHHVFDVLCGCLIGWLESVIQFKIFKFINPLFFSAISNMFTANTNDIDDSSLNFDL